MALLLEVEIPSWLGLPFSSKNYDPTFSQLTGGQPICTLRPVFQRMLQLGEL